MEKKSFVIFKDWTDLIELLPLEQQLQAYKGLIELGYTNTINDNLPIAVKILLNTFKPRLEKNYNRYVNKIPKTNKNVKNNVSKSNLSIYNYSDDELIKMFDNLDSVEI